MSRRRQKSNSILSYVLHSKECRALLIALFILVVMAFFLTNRFTTELEEDVGDYPCSTLSVVPDEQKYIQSDILNNTFCCPTVPYDISIPGTIIENGDRWITSSYGDYTVTLLETSDDAITSLNKRLSTYAMDTIDIPSVEWDDVISDAGYINGYQASYHTGMAKVETHMHSYLLYGVMYEIFTDGDYNLMIYVSTDSREKLAGGKEILDSIIFMMQHQDELVTGDEEIENTESSIETDEDVGATESVAPTLENDISMSDTEDNSYIMENGTIVSNENGITVYSKDYTLYVDEAYEDGLYITFCWINFEIEPIDMYVIAPNGRRYDRDTSLSRSGEWVFVIPKSEAGTYTIHGEATSTIYVSYTNALCKADWYKAYRNIGEDGEPVRGYSE